MRLSMAAPPARPAAAAVAARAPLAASITARAAVPNGHRSPAAARRRLVTFAKVRGEKKVSEESTAELSKARRRSMTPNHISSVLLSALLPGLGSRAQRLHAAVKQKEVELAAAKMALLELVRRRPLGRTCSRSAPRPGGGGGRCERATRTGRAGRVERVAACHLPPRLTSRTRAGALNCGRARRLGRPVAGARQGVLRVLLQARRHLSGRCVRPFPPRRALPALRWSCLESSSACNLRGTPRRAACARACASGASVHSACPPAPPHALPPRRARRRPVVHARGHLHPRRHQLPSRAHLARRVRHRRQPAGAQGQRAGTGPPARQRPARRPPPVSTR